MKKNCIVCGVEFETTQSKSKYCGRACGAKVKYQKGLNSYTFTCQTCGIEYHPKEKSRNKYCSRDCSYKALAKERIERAARLARAREQSLVKVCRVCGVSYIAAKSSSKVCSDVCKKAEARIKSFKRDSAKKQTDDKDCKECGKKFIAEYGDKRSVFCSPTCNQKHARKIMGGNKHRHKAKFYGVKYEPINVLKVFERDSWTCQICGRKAPESLRGKQMPRSPELDHRVPISRGGSHTYDNVQCACRRCNGDKSNKNEAGQMPLFRGLHHNTPSPGLHSLESNH